GAQEVKIIKHQSSRRRMTAAERRRRRCQKAEKAQGVGLEGSGRACTQMTMTALSELERGGGNQRRDTVERIAKGLVETVPGLAARLVAMTGENMQGADDAVSETEPQRDCDVSQYERNAIPVINEGEASPNGLAWDAEARRVSEVEDWTSRPFDFRERGPYAVVLRGDSMEPVQKLGMRLIVWQVQPISSGDVVYVQLKGGERPRVRPTRGFGRRRIPRIHRVSCATI